MFLVTANKTVNQTSAVEPYKLSPLYPELARCGLIDQMAKQILDFAVPAVLTKRAYNVVLLTTIAPDGVGDYFSILNGAKIMKQLLLTNSQVHVIVQKRRELPSVEFAEYGLTHHDMTFIGFSPADFEVMKLGENDIRINCYPTHRSLLDRVKKADLALTWPNALWRIHDWLLKHPKTHIGVGEYGFKEQELAMGLGQDEHGIVVPDVSLADHPFALGHLSPLFEADTCPYFCYGSHLIQFLEFLLSSNEPSVQVICPFSGNGQSLMHLEVGVVKYVTFYQNKKVEKTVHSNPKFSKEVVLINPFPLSHGDFLRCIKLSQAIVGCTGDISFSETIALGKVPFYEIRDHKKRFWQGFVAFAEKHQELDARDFACDLQKSGKMTFDATKLAKAEAAFARLFQIIVQERNIKNELQEQLAKKLATV